MKRFLALALSVLMILCVLLMAGCNGNTDDTPTTGNKKPVSGTTDPNGGEDTTGGGTSSSTTDPYSKLPGYEDISFGGRTFVLVGADGESDGFNSAKEIYSEESDAISVAVRERHDLIEAYYHCTIKG